MMRQIFFGLILSLVVAGQAQAKALPKKIVKSEAAAAAVDPDFAANQAAQNAIQNANENEIPLDAKLVVNTSSIPTGGATVAASTSVTAQAATATPEVVAPAPAPIESKAEVAKLPENQIPVMTEAKAAKKGDSGGLMRIMLTLAVLTALLGGTVYALKRWAKNKGPKSTSTKIRVLTQHSLGPKKNLTIVQVAGETLLIGVTDQNITMLKTLALIDDELPEETPKRFDTALEDYEETDEAPARGGRREPEEFAMRGLAEIRDTVSTRLKNFRNN